MSSIWLHFLHYFRKHNTFVLSLTVQHMPPAPHSLIWSCAGVSSALTQVYFVSATLEVKASYKLSVVNDITMFGDNQSSRHKEVSCKFVGWMVVRMQCGFVTRYIKYFFVQTNFSCNTFPYKKVCSYSICMGRKARRCSTTLACNSCSTTQAFSRTGSERAAKTKRHPISITPLMSSLGLNCTT